MRWMRPRALHEARTKRRFSACGQTRLESAHVAERSQAPDVDHRRRDGAGEDRRLDKKGAYEIRFSRGRSAEGGDHGEARYTIGEGTHRFVVTDRGWDIQRQP